MTRIDSCHPHAGPATPPVCPPGIDWAPASNGIDCDDNEPTTYPGAVDICGDGIDSDCDGNDDSTVYEDLDGDGFGNINVTQPWCGFPPVGWVYDNTDCDDTDPTRFPGNPEVCDRIDNDCDGAVPPEETDDDGDGRSECEGDNDDTVPLFYVGSYAFTDGPMWMNNPPVYSCLEACAINFGGVDTDYMCSTQQIQVDNRAFYDGYADAQYCTGNGRPEDYKFGTNYNCGVAGCSYSAWVQDNCGALFATVNHCFQ